MGGRSRDPIDLAVFSTWTTRLAAVLIALGVVLTGTDLITSGDALTVATLAVLVVSVLGGIVVFARLWPEQHKPLPAAGAPGSTQAEQKRLRGLLLDGSSIEPRLRPAAGVLVVRNLARTSFGHWVDAMLIASSAAQVVSNTSGSAFRIFSGLLLVAFLAAFIKSLPDARRWRRALADPTIAAHVRPL